MSIRLADIRVSHRNRYADTQNQDVMSFVNDGVTGGNGWRIWRSFNADSRARLLASVMGEDFVNALGKKSQRIGVVMMSLALLLCVVLSSLKVAGVSAEMYQSLFTVLICVAPCLFAFGVFFTLFFSEMVTNILLADYEKRQNVQK